MTSADRTKRHTHTNTNDADTTKQAQAALAEPLCDATFRARLLRQGLSNDEIAQYVAAVETERAATKAALDALVAELDRLREELGEAVARADRLEAVLYPPALNREQKRALKHGDGIHSQFDDSTRQGG